MEEHLDFETKDAFKNLISKLQSFFARSPDTIFLDAHGHRMIFKALHLMLRYGTGKNFRSIHGNLNYLKADTWDDLLKLVEEQAFVQQESCDNPFKIECILRSMLACIEGGSHLNHAEMIQVLQYLRPVIDFVEERELLQRQRLD